MKGFMDCRDRLAEFSRGLVMLLITCVLAVFWVLLWAEPVSRY